jgi:hypothetical protein
MTDLQVEPERVRVKKPRLDRRFQLGVITCLVVAICSLVSHGIVRSLGIRSTYSGYRVYSGDRYETHGILHGSSLAYGGIDWAQVCNLAGYAVESRAIPGSSPSEWEIQDHRHSPGVTNAFVVISAYDLNESSLCDFRANLVPFTQTVLDLRAAHSDWPTAKRFLSQYGVTAIRTLFPTVGRSDGVMTGIRDLVRKASGNNNNELDEGVKFGTSGASTIKQRLSDWDQARLQRRLVSMRSAFLGKHSFNGVKKIALRRMAENALARGKVTFIVMPVSPIYRQEFLSPATTDQFEQALNDLRQHCPGAKFIRLDHVGEFDSNDNFSDLVHLNMYGQKIATESLLRELASTTP